MRKLRKHEKSAHCEADPPDALAAKVEALRTCLEEELPQLVRQAVRKELAAGADPEALLTKEDVAGRLNVSPRTVDTLTAAGEIRKIKVRGCVRFHPKAVEAYIRRNAGEVTA